MTLGGKFAGFTECRKQFIDFKGLSAGISLSNLTHTSMMLGSEITDKYNSSTLVGLRHPVIVRHALLSPKSSL